MQPKEPLKMRPRGAFPSPAHLAFAAMPHQASPTPPSYGMIPPKLSIWGNDRFGDCVSAEEAFAKAAYSVAAGVPELLVADADLVAWARKHGYLNGANLTDVMDTMAKTGLPIGSSTYTDGPPQSVDWTNDAVLRSAIYAGPVKIAVAAGQLESAVNQTNDKNGWWAVGFHKSLMSDHCVGLCGFGSAQDLATMLGVSLYKGVSPDTLCYLMFTWGSIGIIDQKSLINITTEAWLRTPTTPGQPTPQPTPSPTPPAPTPTPPSPSGYGPWAFDVPGGTIEITYTPSQPLPPG